MYLFYGVPRAFHNLLKNWPAALNSVLINGSSLAVLGLIVLLYLNVLHMSRVWLSNTTVSLFLQTDVTSDRRTALLEQVSAHPLVVRAELVSPDQGLKTLAAKLGAEENFLTEVEKDGLPYTIDFEIRVDYRERVGVVAEGFRRIEGVEDVVYAERVLEKVKFFFQVTQGVGLFFTALILGSFCLVIANATRLSLHARRQEIEILHLAGATRGFIRSAFVVEGVLLAGLAWAVALGLVYFAFQLILAGLTWNEFTTNLRELTVFFSQPMLATALGVMAALGGVSSHLSVNHLLRGLEP